MSLFDFYNCLDESKSISRAINLLTDAMLELNDINDANKLEARKLAMLRGLRTEDIAKNLRSTNSACNELIQHLCKEANALSVMYGQVVFFDNEAKKIINNIITISHSDMEKICNELKYYSQSSDSVNNAYQKMFLDKLNSGGNVELTREQYHKLKDLYYLIKNSKNGNYKYTSCTVAGSLEDLFTNPELAETSSSLKFKPDIGIKVKDSKYDSNLRAGVSGKGSAETKFLKLEYVSKYDLKYGLTGETKQTLYLDVGKISGEIKITPGITSKLFEELAKRKDSGESGENMKKIINEILGFKAEVGGSVTAFIYTNETEAYNNDKNGIYSDTVITLGEFGAKAEAGVTGIDMKANVTAAKMEVTDGAILWGHKVGAKGTIQAGVEGSIHLGGNKGSNKKSAEANVGFTGLGLEYEPPSVDDPYVWVE